MGYFDFDQRLSPEGYAREVACRFGLNTYPIDVIKIIQDLGVKYLEKDFGTNKIDGGLIRQDNKAVIFVNSAIPYEGRKNFTRAHEVGHLVIKGHNNERYSCSPYDIASYSATAKNAENEANKFAAELLMPTAEIKKITSRFDFCLNTIQDVSGKFGVSLQSAALRVVQSTNERCAIALSHNGKVMWSWGSNSFKYRVRNGNLHEHSYAIDFFSPSGQPVPGEFTKVAPTAWLTDSNIPWDLNIQEHSVHFNDLNMVLSLITIPYNDEEEDELFDD